MNNCIKRILVKLCFAGILLLSNSCINKLDFVGETKEGQLVIYGLFTNSNEKQVVNVSRTSAFGLAPREFQMRRSLY